METKKYLDVLAEIATDLAKKYLAIVNFVCLPKYFLELVRLRMERAKELLDEAEKYFDKQNATHVSEEPQ